MPLRKNPGTEEVVRQTVGATVAAETESIEATLTVAATIGTRTTAGAAETNTSTAAGAAKKVGAAIAAGAATSERTKTARFEGAVGRTTATTGFCMDVEDMLPPRCSSLKRGKESQRGQRRRKSY